MIRSAEEFDSRMSRIDEILSLMLVRRKGINSICLSIRLRSTRRNGIRYHRPILLMRSSSESIRRGGGWVGDPVCRGSRPGDRGLLDAAHSTPDNALHGEPVVSNGRLLWWGWRAGFGLGDLCVEGCVGGAVKCVPFDVVNPAIGRSPILRYQLPIRPQRELFLIRLDRQSSSPTHQVILFRPLWNLFRH